MVVHLDNTHITYHTKPYKTKPNNTKPNQISLKWLKIFHGTLSRQYPHIIPDKTIPNKTKQYQTKPNIIKMAITQSIFKIEARNFAW